MLKIRFKTFFDFLIIIMTFALLLFSVLAFFIRDFGINHFEVSIMSVCCIFLSFYILLFKLSHIHGNTLAYITYLIFTQLGNPVVVYFLGIAELNLDTSYYNVGWIFSGNYPKAVLLGIIAILTITIISFLLDKFRACNVGIIRNNHSEDIKINRIFTLVGNNILFLIAIFLIWVIITGQIVLTGTYSDFMKFAESNSWMWVRLLLFLPIGFSYAFICSTGRQRRIFYLLYGFIAFVLLVTGNKGEVFYTVLAAMGMKTFIDNKVHYNIVIYGLIVVFFIIPSLTSLRQVGVLNNFINLSGVDFAAPFIEMGSQLRLSVFMIDEVSSNARDYLYGFSYYNPLINGINTIFPLIDRLQEPRNFDFYTFYDGMGFSQVAESYANFGIIGVIVFHVIVTTLLSYFDNSRTIKNKCALNLSLMAILINMTRNVFAPVLGQSIICIVFYVLVMFFIKQGEKAN